jgi:nicotinate-nucleotide adenylyltransferase
MNIGVFGFSCDPPTVAHMHFASDLAEQAGLDKVVMMPCSNNRTDKMMKTDDKHRWAMLLRAIGDNPLFIADHYEMTKPAAEVFTYFTMEHLKTYYAGHDLFFMMGADLLIDIAKGEWEYGKELVENNRFIVTSRNGVDLQSVLDASVFLEPYNDDRWTLLQQEHDLDISSTAIRKAFAEGRNPRYLLPNTVYEYIKACNLYQF